MHVELLQAFRPIFHHREGKLLLRFAQPIRGPPLPSLSPLTAEKSQTPNPKPYKPKTPKP